VSPSLRIPPHNKPRPHLALPFFPPDHYRTAQLQTLYKFCIAFPTTNPFAIASIYLLLSRIVSNCYSRFVVRYVAPPSLSMLFPPALCESCLLRFLLAASLVRDSFPIAIISRCSHFPLQSLPAAFLPRYNRFSLEILLVARR
jgi:hypothetical protein